MYITRVTEVTRDGHSVSNDFGVVLVLKASLERVFHDSSFLLKSVSKSAT